VRRGTRRLNETHDLPESHRWLFERMEKRGGILNIFRALSHSPEALRRFMKFGSYFLDEGKLDPKLRELAILRAGYLCRAPYEVSQHVSFGRRVGLSDSQIRGVAEPNHALFAPKEMAVLAFAGELTSGARVSDAAYSAVAEFLNDEEIVELILVIGYYNMVSRAQRAVDIDAGRPDLAEVGIEIKHREPGG
jgi:alkylhydroperoxidase family enzyme